MASKKTKKPARKVVKKPNVQPSKVSVQVATEPKHVEIDWNIWHNPLMECIRAFNMHEMLYLVETHKIAYVGMEHEPITSNSLYNDIVHVCEKLIDLHINNWVYDDSRPIEGVNTYRDDNGTLVAETSYACTEEIPGVFLDPRLVITLFTNHATGPWFQISFQLVSQTF